ncbi:hypothetical protein NC651_033057 [Populus alba x Populus x berolinensis]|nr:hypothetical protein NC651_033057 [Populus alba x Populus x berolinensis]
MMMMMMMMKISNSSVRSGSVVSSFLRPQLFFVFDLNCLLQIRSVELDLILLVALQNPFKLPMEVFGKSMMSAPANVVYLSTILGLDGPIPVHKCDCKCQNEHVFGNMYRCRLTGLTHICDKNCNQRILYDNHSSLCRASRQIFPLSPAEEQAVRGVRRKLDAENSSAPTDSCSFKRRRDAQFHPSPFERSFSAVSPICSQVGDGMDMS